MKINNDEVKITFDTHPKQNELHFTSDGQTFFKKDEAFSHALGRKLENKAITTITRTQFFAGLASVESETPAADNGKTGDAPAIEMSHSAKKILEDAGIDPATVPTGADGKISKKEAEAAVKAKEEAEAANKNAGEGGEKDPAETGNNGSQE